MKRWIWFWRWRTLWIHNLRVFWKPVWHFNSCDYYGLLSLMETALREMRDLHRDHGITTDAGRIVRHLTVAAELCRRIKEDKYFENAGYDPERWDSMSEARKDRIIKHADAMAEADGIYLGRVFRFVRHWWQ